MGTEPTPPGDFTARLTEFEAMCDGIRQLSELLTGLVATLIAEGWTEGQARDLVVASMLMQAHNPQPTQPS